MENIMRLNTEYNNAYIETKNIILKCINNPEDFDTDDIFKPQQGVTPLPDKSNNILNNFLTTSKPLDVKEHLFGISRLEIECILRYLQITVMIKETLCDLSLDNEDDESNCISVMNDIIKNVEMVFNTK
jgi:hypothetical protein